MRLRIWGAFAGAAVGWGTGGVATRAALNDGVPPVALVAIRGVIATALIGVLIAAMRRPWTRVAQTWRLGSIMAVLNLAAPFVLYTFAYRYASAGYVGILIALVPIVTAAIAHFVLPDEPLHTRKVIALAVAFGGVGLLLASGNSGLAEGGRPLVAATLAIAGVIAISFANVHAKVHAGWYEPMSLLTTQFVVGTVLLVAVALIVEGVPTGISPWGWVLIAYMSVASTVLPFFLYYWVLRHTTSTEVAMIGYYVPLVALLSGIAFLGEKLQAGIVAGGLVIFVGVVLAGRAERLRAAASRR